MKLDVQPIVRALDLGEYDAAIYAGQVVYVWVNAPTDFLRRREELLVEYSQQFRELQRLRLQHVQGSRFALTKVLPWKHPLSEGLNAEEVTVTRFNSWVRDTFLPRIHGWFAELLSQGPEESRWTVEELDEVYRRDSVLLEWIKRRSLEMVQDYAAEKKRPCAPPSSA